MGGVPSIFNKVGDAQNIYVLTKGGTFFKGLHSYNLLKNILSLLYESLPRYSKFWMAQNVKQVYF